MNPPKVAVFVGDGGTSGQLGRQLASCGLEPHLFADAAACLTWVMAEQPGLVLTDASLAVPGGVPLAQALKLHPEANRLPQVLLRPGREALDPHGLHLVVEAEVALPTAAGQFRDAVRHALRAGEERRQAGGAWEVEFRFWSLAENLERLTHLMETMWFLPRLPARQQKHLILAVREMGTNAIEWGHRKDPDQTVTVRFWVDQEKVVILIRDSGPGFNPTQLPHAADRTDPLRHIEVRKASGLRDGGFGIMMTRGLVDDLTYNEKGNEVRLVRHFPGKGPAGSHPVEGLAEAVAEQSTRGTPPGRPTKVPEL